MFPYGGNQRADDHEVPASHTSYFAFDHVLSDALPDRENSEWLKNVGAGYKIRNWTC
jgi:hypothetical protein